MTLKIIKHSSFLILFIVLTLLVGLVPASANDLPVCKDIQGGRNDDSIRERLLSGVKENLLKSSNEAKQSIKSSSDCFNNESDEQCKNFHDVLMKSISDQFQMAKIATALGSKDYSAILKLKVKDLTALIDKNKIHPTKIANFSNKSFTYSEKDQNLVFDVWHLALLTELDDQVKKSQDQNSKLSCYDFENQIAKQTLEKIKRNFSGVANQMTTINPLLGFLTEQNHQDPKAVAAALKKLEKLNADFIYSIEGLKTQQSNSYLSFVNLAVWDHEMGLVNYPQQANEVIAGLPVAERANACASWDYLTFQQSTRVKSSIGVGFSTSVLCGVSLWSGVGTAPALALCTPALMDSVWGAFVGYDYSNVSFESAYAGRKFGIQSFSGGLRSLEEAENLTRQGQIVSLINLLSVIPVVKGVSHATKGVRSSIKELVKLPTVDVSVSMTESNSGQIVKWIFAIKSAEILTLNMRKEFPNLQSFKDKCDNSGNSSVDLVSN